MQRARIRPECHPVPSCTWTYTGTVAWHNAHAGTRLSHYQVRSYSESLYAVHKTDFVSELLSEKAIAIATAKSPPTSQAGCGAHPAHLDGGLRSGSRRPLHGRSAPALRATGAAAAAHARPPPASPSANKAPSIAHLPVSATTVSDDRVPARRSCASTHVCAYESGTASVRQGSHPPRKPPAASLNACPLSSPCALAPMVSKGVCVSPAKAVPNDSRVQTEARPRCGQGTADSETETAACLGAALYSQETDDGWVAGADVDNGQGDGADTVARQLAVEAHTAGFSPSELRAVGLSAAPLLNAGYSAEQLIEAGYSAADLRAAGHSAAMLLGVGFAAAALIDAGFSAGELSFAGS